MNNSKFQLKDLQLINIDYKFNDKYQSEDRLKLNMKSETIISKAFEDRVAEVTFNLNIFCEEELDIVPFSLRISYKGKFYWGEQLDPKKADELLRMNAPSILLSYIRPFVSQFTSASGYPTLILPLIDFTQNKVTLN